MRAICSDRDVMGYYRQCLQCGYTFLNSVAGRNVASWKCRPPALAPRRKKAKRPPSPKSVFTRPPDLAITKLTAKPTAPPSFRVE
jgi:hypothetical protein